MSTSNATRLRASCERCRGQKLRCLPSSETDPRAPCQRCVRAKTADSCIFVSRSRTQRPIRSRTTSDGLLQCKDLNLELSFPGTSIFALNPNSNSNSNSESLEPGSTFSPMTNQEPYNNFSASSEYMSIPWEDDSQLFSQHPWNDSMFMEGLDSLASEFSLSNSAEGSTRTNSSKASSSSPSLWPLDTCPGDRDVVLFDQLDQVAEENSDPIVNLTNLLAEMSRYEQQLSQFSSEDIANFPVGDALYFSQLFQKIISPAEVSEESALSTLDTSTVLLVLSCFMTLIRLYSAIFRYFVASLSKDPIPHVPINGCTDYRSYRGLRLAQLHSVCLCSQGELMKSTVSMLLKSLRTAEDLLDLPADVRATIVSNGTLASSPRKALQRKHSNDSEDGDERLVLAQGSAPMVKSQAFYWTVGLQAKELRCEYEQLQDLFARMSIRKNDASCDSHRIEPLIY